jgi:hypothetical protein
VKGKVGLEVRVERREAILADVAGEEDHVAENPLTI